MFGAPPKGEADSASCWQSALAATVLWALILLVLGIGGSYALGWVLSFDGPAQIALSGYLGQAAVVLWLVGTVAIWARVGRRKQAEGKPQLPAE